MSVHFEEAPVVDAIAIVLNAAGASKIVGLTAMLNVINRLHSRSSIDGQEVIERCVRDLLMLMERRRAKETV